MSWIARWLAMSVPVARSNAPFSMIVSASRRSAITASASRMAATAVAHSARRSVSRTWPMVWSRSVGTLFDHHIHSDRSDGTVSLVDRAKSVAVRPHGVSDHYPWRDRLKDEDDVLRYLDEASRLGLRVGIEYDLGVAPPLSTRTRDALHYVIGAMHQVQLEDGMWVRFDNAGAFLKGRVKEFSDAAKYMDEDLASRIRERTLEVVRVGIERDGIDILGHATMGPLAALGDPERFYPAEGQEGRI